MPGPYPRKYWWAVLVAVPVAVAVIGIVPRLIPGSGGGSSNSSTFNLQGAEFQDEVTMIDTQIIMEQVQEGPDSDELQALIQRAVNLSRTGFRDEAIELFEGLAERTESPAVYNNLGALYAAEGQSDAALAAYREGLARDPESESLTLNLARLYSQQNRTAEALTVLDNIPETASARMLRAEISEGSSNGTRESEPNNDANSPNLATIGTTLAGILSTQSDADFYAFDVPPLPRDWTRISVRNGSPALKLSLAVFNPDKSLLWRNSQFAYEVTAGQDVINSLVLMPQQRYFISVTSLEGTGSYDLTIENLGLADAYEPNDEAITPAAINVGDSIEANLLDQADVDQYAVQGAGSFSVVLENLNTALKPRMTIFDRDGVQIWSSSAFGYEVTAGQNLRTGVEVASPDNFRIRISSLENNGNYRLVLTEN